jgi:hypothetical protein
MGWADAGALAAGPTVGRIVVATVGEVEQPERAAATAHAPPTKQEISVFI